MLVLVGSKQSVLRLRAWIGTVSVCCSPAFKGLRCHPEPALSCWVCSSLEEAGETGDLGGGSFVLPPGLLRQALKAKKLETALGARSRGGNADRGGQTGVPKPG